jgi:hypothetical protein
MKKRLSRRVSRLYKELGALVDQCKPVDHQIREWQRCLRENRAEFKEATRMDLVRKVAPPMRLIDLAGFLWRNEPIVFVKSSVAKRAENYLTRFTLVIAGSGYRPSDGEIIVPELSLDSRHLEGLLINKTMAKIKKGTSPSLAIKEVVIQLAPFTRTFEEWACIFPDAAAAGDYDFIIRIVEGFRERRRLGDRDEWETIIAHWNVGLIDGVPPLKHWTDQAACEFVRFIEGAKGSLRMILSHIERHRALNNYQQRKSRHSCHCEKPTLVNRAYYTREDEVRRLCCSLY